MTKIVEKVVAYITKGTSLLVFRHVHSNAGIQVPAGTLELDETTEDGVLREAKEETGLSHLEIRRFLGAREYDMSSFGLAEIHRRYYYHLECLEETPPQWRHFELYPSEGPSEQIEFELFWVSLPDQVPELAATQGDLLADLDFNPSAFQPKAGGVISKSEQKAGSCKRINPNLPRDAGV